MARCARSGCCLLPGACARGTSCGTASPGKTHLLLDITFCISLFYISSNICGLPTPYAGDLLPPSLRPLPAPAVGSHSGDDGEQRVQQRQVAAHDAFETQTQEERRHCPADPAAAEPSAAGREGPPPTAGAFNNLLQRLDDGAAQPQPREQHAAQRAPLPCPAQAPSSLGGLDSSHRHPRTASSNELHLPPLPPPPALHGGSTLQWHSGVHSPPPQRAHGAWHHASGQPPIPPAARLQAMQETLRRQGSQLAAPCAHSEQEYMAMVDDLLLLTTSVSVPAVLGSGMLAAVWSRGVAGAPWPHQGAVPGMQGNPDRQLLATSILKVLLSSSSSSPYPL